MEIHRSILSYYVAFRDTFGWRVTQDQWRQEEEDDDEHYVCNMLIYDEDLLKSRSDLAVGGTSLLGHAT